MALELEQQTYAANLPELKLRAGKYVVIQKDKVLGIFDTYNDALTDGYKQCGLEPFLVKQIQIQEQIQPVSRFVPHVREFGSDSNSW